MNQAQAINNTIGEFLNQIGFADFTWQGTPLTLSFEQSGTLHLEMTKAGLLIAQLREIKEYEATDMISKALRSVHSDQALPLVVQTGMKSLNQLAFMTTLSPQQLTISGLTDAMDILNYLHQQITQ